MSLMLNKLLRAIWPNPQKRRASELYIALVAQARNPYFYETLKVADSVDGRFDMIVLHLALMVEAIEMHEKDVAMIQLRNALMEYAIEDMDRNLREMGVSDTSVSKKMKKLASALNGRFVTYRAAQDAQAWSDALARNLYRAESIEGLEGLEDMTRYAVSLREEFAKNDVSVWLRGEVSFGKNVPSNAQENTNHSDAA